MTIKARKTKMISFRVEQEVYVKFKRKHPNVSAYLRDKMKREVNRGN